MKRIGAQAFLGCFYFRRMIFKNPNMEFGLKVFDTLLEENVTLIGYENSTAKAYAEQYGYKFELIQ